MTSHAIECNVWASNNAVCCGRKDTNMTSHAIECNVWASNNAVCCGHTPRCDESSELTSVADCAYCAHAVRELRAESVAVGDHAMVEICDAALVGEAGALEECVRVIQAAMDMDE